MVNVENQPLVKVVKLRKLPHAIQKDTKFDCVGCRLDFVDAAIAKMNIEKYMYATYKNNPDYGVLCYKVFDEKRMRGLIVDSAGKQIIMSSFYEIQSRKLGKKILSLKSEKNA